VGGGVQGLTQPFIENNSQTYNSFSIIHILFRKVLILVRVKPLLKFYLLIKY